MPHLPLVQQIYLGGVVVSFVTFMAVVAYGAFMTNRRPASIVRKAPERHDRREAA